MADLNILLQYAERVRGRLLQQQKTFAERLQAVAQQWQSLDMGLLPLASYQIPLISPTCKPYTVLAADSSPLELSRHRAVELKAVSLSRVFTDYKLASEKIERQIVDLDQDDVASLSNPLLELEYAIGFTQSPDLVLIDGSLIRWQWEQLTEKKKLDLVNKYVELLTKSYSKLAPVLAVIDHSQGRDIIDELEKLSGEHYKGLVDEDLFELVLEVNSFSPVFKADSPILGLNEEYQIGYVYYRATAGVLRLELMLNQSLPVETWERVIDQTRKGKGFPFSIARAHDSCVIKHKDKFLLEQSLMKFSRVSQKERLKRLG